MHPWDVLRAYAAKYLHRRYDWRYLCASHHVDQTPWSFGLLTGLRCPVGANSFETPRAVRLSASTMSGRASTMSDQWHHERNMLGPEPLVASLLLAVRRSGWIRRNGWASDWASGPCHTRLGSRIRTVSGMVRTETRHLCRRLGRWPSSTLPVAVARISTTNTNV